MLRQFKDAHYRRVLDEPVPMLGDRTPRECAHTKSGRARLVRWLKDLENGEQPGAAASGQPAYDVTWIWQELGLQPTVGELLPGGRLLYKWTLMLRLYSIAVYL